MIVHSESGLWQVRKVRIAELGGNGKDRIGAKGLASAAAAGLARLFHNYAPFLANRDCARAAQLLSAGAGVSPLIALKGTLSFGNPLRSRDYRITSGR